MGLIGNRRSNKGKEMISLLDPEWWLLWSWPVDPRLLSRDWNPRAWLRDPDTSRHWEEIWAGLELGGQPQLVTVFAIKGGSRSQWHEVDSADAYCTTGSGCSFFTVYWFPQNWPRTWERWIWERVKGSVDPQAELRFFSVWGETPPFP